MTELKEKRYINLRKVQVEERVNALDIIKNIIKIAFIFYIAFYFSFNLINPNLTAKTLGFKPYIILTNSMEPEYNIGDMVIITKADIHSVKVGDVVAFSPDGKNGKYTVTHKVAESYYGHNFQKVLRTKPINFNGREEKLDKWIIREENLIGKVNFKIPKIGKLLLFITSPVGKRTVVMALFLIVFYTLIKTNMDNELNRYKRYVKHKDRRIIKRERLKEKERAKKKDKTNNKKR